MDMTSRHRLRSDVTRRMVARLATNNDVTSAASIDPDLHGGLDQLPALLERHLSDPNRRVCVCELDGQVIGLQVALVVDDGSTIVLQSARLSPPYRQLGVWPEVRRRFLTLLRDFRRVPRCARISAYPMTSRADVAYIMERPAVQIRPTLQDVSRVTSSIQRHLSPYNKDTGHVAQLCTNTLWDVLSSPENQRNLFPHDRIIVSWEPYRLLPSNFKLISESTDAVFGTAEKGKCCFSSLSFGRALQVPSGLRYDVDYYGSDVSDVCAHVCKHLERCVRFYQHGDISLELFIPSTLNQDQVRLMLREDFGLTLKPPGLVCYLYEGPYVASKL